MPAGKTYTPLATQTLTTASASVTFSNISGNYTDLVLMCKARGSDTSAVYDAIGLQFNGDTSSKYSNTEISGDGSTAGSYRRTSQTSLTFGRLSPSTNSFLAFDASYVNIQNYSNATTYKSVLSRTSAMNEYYEVIASAGLWASTSAITSIKLIPAVSANFVAGSTFTLYGILAA